MKADSEKTTAELGGKEMLEGRYSRSTRIMNGIEVNKCKRHGHNGHGPAKGHKDDEGIVAPLL